MYSVLVENFRSAYIKAGRYVKEKYNCHDHVEMNAYMEKEFNVISRPGKKDSSEHCFEFNSEKDYLMFLLRWS